MKNILFLLLLLPLIGTSQIAVHTLLKIQVGGTSHPTGVLVDTSYRRIYEGTQHLTYDPLRPNIEVLQTADETITMDGVLTGFTGTLRVYATGGVLHLNGIIIATIPVSSANYVLTYSVVSGIINWN